MSVKVIKSKSKQATIERVLKDCERTLTDVEHPYGLKSELTQFISKTHVHEFLISLKNCYNRNIWERCENDIVKNIVYAMKRSTNGKLCSFDFYKAIKKSGYFGIERASNRLSQFGVSESSNVRKNFYGHSKFIDKSNMDADVFWFITQLRVNWKMFLALGARCQFGKYSDTSWKTDQRRPDCPYNLFKVNNNTFKIVFSSSGPRPDTIKAQVISALSNVSKDVFSNVIKITEDSVQIKIAQSVKHIDFSKVDENAYSPVEGIKLDIEKELDKISKHVIYLETEISNMNGELKHNKEQYDKLFAALSALK
ncbi:hypothetical protein AVV36_gp092 [Pectobacterium bacteriophage PM2]|uniref:Uncharacterized protein n=1 Tax=Pectobacterium bacteriophage PM2 TaxID=1429794 RepID=A0A0A0PZG4_9CAUD|nr:hypothetical protein AVV36_gp092 [Pectobacterium bacteriophage PM2]AHY25054.1 hypothetical protein PM2_092 [Pectobacterium bacteriophage PM2]